MFRRLIVGVLVIAALVAFGARSARAAEPYGCLTFEDDSFVCGTIITTDDSGGWSWDDSLPFVAGCIPGGYCDTEGRWPTGTREDYVPDWTDDCPLGLEDVECWEATRPAHPTPTPADIRQHGYGYN